MVFGGIGCVSLLFSIPMVFVSDDVDEKLFTVIALLLCVSVFAAAFALGFYLRDKRPAAQKTPAAKTELPTDKPAAQPAPEAEPQPVTADPPASEPTARPDNDMVTPPAGMTIAPAAL